jgi:hypothetical protein
MKSVYAKIGNHEYRNNEGYPSHTMRKSNPEVYYELIEQWHEEELKLKNQFRFDLEEEFDMLVHPLRDPLWESAWEHGHSSGYHEVLTYYSDFYERFIRPMNNYVKTTFGVEL